MKEDEELVMLRISVARLAQAMGVDNSLQVANGSYEQLFTIAKTQQRGWNDLVGRMVAEVYLNRVGETVAPVDLRQRITKLEFQSSDRHERLRVLEQALTERVSALEKRVFEDLGAIIEQEFIASMAVTDVVGHDTVQNLTDRVSALETKLKLKED